MNYLIPRSFTQVRVSSPLLVAAFLCYAVTQEAQAFPVKKTFQAPLNLAPYIRGEKPIANTEDEKSLVQLCNSKGYDGYETFQKELDDTYSVTCIGDSERVLKFRLGKSQRTSRPSPISMMERKLKGKLFFVHTLPALSEDGTLIATYQPKGVHIGERYDKTVIQADRLETLHFSINSLVQFNAGFGGERYAEHPFVVVFPANQNREHNILDSVTSFSFTEAITLGNYHLPPNAIILYRAKGLSKKEPSWLDSASYERHVDRAQLEATLLVELSDSDRLAQESMQKVIANYQRMGYRTVPFDDSQPKFVEGEFSVDGKKIKTLRVKYQPNFQAKYDAVKRVILENGGFEIRPIAKGYESTIIPGPDGSNINTPEFSKALFPGKAISFGLDDYTQRNSPGEQWRSMPLRGNWPRIPDPGFSIEEHHRAKYTEWMRGLNLPAFDQHLRFARNNAIAFRANDLVFGHFKNKAKAEAYIRDYLKARNETADFKAQFQARVDSDLSVDVLAKEFVDYPHLSQIQDVGPFSLVMSQNDFIDHLWGHTAGMHPREASEFFNAYFEQSAHLKEFPAAAIQEVRSIVQNTYVVLYFNDHHRPEKLSQEDEQILFRLMLPKRETLPLLPTTGHTLRRAGYHLDALVKMTGEELHATFQGLFERTFSALQKVQMN